MWVNGQKVSSENWNQLKKKWRELDSLSEDTLQELLHITVLVCVCVCVCMYIPFVSVHMYSTSCALVVWYNQGGVREVLQMRWVEGSINKTAAMPDMPKPNKRGWKAAARTPRPPNSKEREGKGKVDANSTIIPLISCQIEAKSTDFGV